MIAALQHDGSSPPGAAGVDTHQASPALEAAFDRLSARTRRFARGAEIFAEGCPADKVYRIVSGAVRISRLLSDGRRQVCDFLYSGEVLGPEAGLAHRTTAEAMTDTVIQVVSRKALADLAASDLSITGELWRLSLAWFNRSRQHALLLARQSATERLAGFLLAQEGAASGEIELPMTRQDIGDYLGLTIHTVSRSISQLQAEGVIELLSQRRIRVLQASALDHLHG